MSSDQFRATDPRNFGIRKSRSSIPIERIGTAYNTLVPAIKGQKLNSETW